MKDRFSIHKFIPSHPQAGRKHVITCDLTYRSVDDDSSITLLAGTHVVEVGVAIDAEDPNTPWMAAKVNKEVYMIPYQATISVEHQRNGTRLR